MTRPLVVFDNVAKRFDGFVAVKRMNLAINEGEFLAIMGPSGCGKTTTLRMLAGLEDPTEGDIRLEGKSLVGVKPHERGTPLVWQSLALFPFLNARENVEFGLKMRGMDKPSRRAKAMDWLGRLGIGEFAERDVNSLSGGQRQRVALARALVTEPRILLLDEPLSALDAHLVIRMQAVLTKLQRELGITFVYVTHSQSEAFAMADRVVIMSNGEIAQTGSARDIYRTPANRFVAEFVGRNNIFSGTALGAGKIETPCGVFDIKSQAQAGARQSFAVSADLMSISRDEPAAGNRIPAQLISEEFVGSMMTLFLEGPDGSELKVQAQERALESIPLGHGQKLYLYFKPEHAHILDPSQQPHQIQAISS
jgi:spermidine/putrescine transport system ATP-binding protein